MEKELVFSSDFTLHVAGCPKMDSTKSKLLSKRIITVMALLKLYLHVAQKFNRVLFFLLSLYSAR